MRTIPERLPAQRRIARANAIDAERLAARELAEVHARRAEVQVGPDRQQALADALGGVVLGPNTISVGGVLVTNYLSSVRVNGVVIGCHDDPTEVLAARFAQVVSA